ncbi:MAG: hypothetical protein IT462_07600 [Planctomycetes bacterium]|nr:hypothetical protein [Planctomycetota bacterium]
MALKPLSFVICRKVMRKRPPLSLNRVFVKAHRNLMVLSAFSEFGPTDEPFTTFVKLLGPDGQHIDYSDPHSILANREYSQVAFVLTNMTSLAGPHEVQLFANNDLVAVRTIPLT